MSLFLKIEKSVLIARSGNIIGGGDFSDDRIIPDYINALNKNKKLIIRNPNSTRPWQHVLDAIDAYLKLIEKHYKKPNNTKELSWNVASTNNNNISVFRLVNYFNSLSNKKVKFNFIYNKKFLKLKN